MRKKITIIILLFIIGFFFINFSPFKQQKETKTNIVFWTLQMGTFSDYINGIIESFEKEHTDINIIWIDVPYSEGEKRTLAAILSKNPPDLINSTPDFSVLLAQRKALYEIPNDVMANYVESINTSLKYNDKYFGLPFYATSAITFYNQDLLNKANINTIPKTYHEMYMQSKQIKNKTGKFVTMPTLTENDTLLKVLNKYNINSPETINSEISQHIFNDYKYVYKHSLIPKESITQGHREALEKYMSGEIAYLQTGANFLNIIKENAPSIFNKTKITNQLSGETGLYDFSLMNLIIPIKSKHPDEALEFATYLTNSENQLKLSKLTSILPVNKKTLEDDYFSKVNINDLFSVARKTSANQLNNLQPPLKKIKNQKELITLSNNYTQEIILGNRGTKEILDEFSKQWTKLNNGN